MTADRDALLDLLGAIEGALSGRGAIDLGKVADLHDAVARTRRHLDRQRRLDAAGDAWDEQLVADAVDDLRHLDGPEDQRRTLADLVEEARERGREDVRAYARRVAVEERARLTSYRASARKYLDPTMPAAVAAEYASRAAASSAVVVHLSTVGTWTP